MGPKVPQRVPTWRSNKFGVPMAEGNMQMANTRRPHGDGTIYRADSTKADGTTVIRWHGQIDLGRDAGGKRRRRKVTGKTKAEVSNVTTSFPQSALSVSTNSSQRRSNHGWSRKPKLAPPDPRSGTTGPISAKHSPGHTAGA
jgi:hypothetical protein